MSKEISKGDKVKNKITKVTRTIVAVKKTKDGNVYRWSSGKQSGTCSEKTLKAWIAGKDQ